MFPFLAVDSNAADLSWELWLAECLFFHRPAKYRQLNSAKSKVAQALAHVIHYHHEPFSRIAPDVWHLALPVLNAFSRKRIGARLAE